jgi:hypothetical protein
VPSSETEKAPPAISSAIGTADPSRSSVEESKRCAMSVC